MEENQVNATETVALETLVRGDDPQRVVCRKCGASLQEGHDFCPKCGQKANLDGDMGASSASNLLSAAVNKISEIIRKTSKKKLAAVLAVVAVLVIGIAAGPTLFSSVEDLCAQGNYKAAFIKASGDEKLAVIAENAIAVLSEESIDMLKDPSSFVLRDGYYSAEISSSELYQRAVLRISAKNSYGNYVDAYWFYVNDRDTDCWEYRNSYSSIDVENDDTLTDLAAKSMIERMVTGVWSINLSKDQVKRINTMFKDDTLHKVKLINSKTIFSFLSEG